MQVVFEIDTRRTNNLLLFFHEPRRTFVVEDIFGMDVLQLPKVDDSNRNKKTLYGNYFFRIQVPDSTKEPTSIKMVKVTPTLLQKLSKVYFKLGNIPVHKQSSFLSLTMTTCPAPTTNRPRSASCPAWRTTSSPGSTAHCPGEAAKGRRRRLTGGSALLWKT